MLYTKVMHFVQHIRAKLMESVDVISVKRTDDPFVKTPACL